MPAWVDAVEYGKFGQATVTATLFGGMDPSIYAVFEKDIDGQMAVSNTQLKHSQGMVRHSLVAIPRPIQDVAKRDKEVPLGSSGIQIRMKVYQLAEGFRPGRIVRIRPKSWPDDTVGIHRWPFRRTLPNSSHLSQVLMPTCSWFLVLLCAGKKMGRS